MATEIQGCASQSGSIGNRDPGLCKPKWGGGDTSTGDTVPVVALQLLCVTGVHLRLQTLASRKSNAISATCMRAAKALTRRQHPVPSEISSVAQGEHKCCNPQHSAASTHIPGMPQPGNSQQSPKQTLRQSLVNNFCFFQAKVEQQWWDPEGSLFTGNTHCVTVCTWDSPLQCLGHMQRVLFTRAFLINWCFVGEGGWETGL